jgi:twitching motility two-component system response regulator PilH
VSGTVLIVEDDRDSREMLAALVEFEGLGVHMACDGVEALEVLEHLRPCLVLLDLMMPRMNGWELRSRMLSEQRLADIPVIVLSGISDMEEAGAALGVQAAFSKPVDLKRLLDTIKQIC